MALVMAWAKYCAIASVPMHKGALTKAVRLESMRQYAKPSVLLRLQGTVKTRAEWATGCED
jgi:hypothetical protein